MSPEANDPRLTAYALGELDEREAAIFEAELRQSPDGQRALAEIRHTAEMLRQALATEAAPELTAEVRERIIAGGQTVEANGEAIAPVSDEAVPVGVTVDDAHAEPSLRPVSPTSPAERRASWLRRHRIAAAVVALSIVAFGLLWPALKGGGERLSWVDVPPGGADAASRVASDTGKVVLTQDDPSELVVRFNALMDEQRYAEAEVLATRRDAHARRTGRQADEASGQIRATARGWREANIHGQERFRGSIAVSGYDCSRVGFARSGHRRRSTRKPAGSC